MLGVGERNGACQLLCSWRGPPVIPVSSSHGLRRANYSPSHLCPAFSKLLVLRCIFVGCHPFFLRAMILLRRVLWAVPEPDPADFFFLISGFKSNWLKELVKFGPSHLQRQMLSGLCLFGLPCVKACFSPFSEPPGPPPVCRQPLSVLLPTAPSPFLSSSLVSSLCLFVKFVFPGIGLFTGSFMQM